MKTKRRGRQINVRTTSCFTIIKHNGLYAASEMMKLKEFAQNSNFTLRFSIIFDSHDRNKVKLAFIGN